MRRAIFAVSVLAGTLLLTPATFGADHLDGPGVSADAAADITDVYAWMNGDGTKLNLIMNTVPLAATTATLSDAVQYVFHVQSGTAFGTTPTTTNVIVQYDGTDAEIWVGDTLYVKGATGGTIGNGTLQAYTGVRNDPFFFNLEGLLDAQATVVSLAPGLDFTTNPGGCPVLDAGQSAALIAQLEGTNVGADPAEDFFAGLNVVSIIIQVDVNHVNGGGDFLSVYGATYTRN